MSNLTAPLDYFLDGGAPKYAQARKAAGETRHLSVYRVENYKLVRVCSLHEFRVAVSMAGMLMAVYAFEMRLARDPDTKWFRQAEFSSVSIAQALVSQGNNPLLIEAAIELWQGNGWPEDARFLKGYNGGIEGYGRLARACWTPQRQSVDLTEHGVSSVYPRTKAAIKHLKARGLQLEHEQLIHEVFGAMQQTWHFQFLDM
ncbi:hypothetical protein WJ96_05080 [Burkholderia ubonensis]|uniref:Uncharacterized protein n=1 Tax=Burkholderia ubonensis TaxID=101571 RepID=A0AAW3MVY4_9BURK|nr:hypothetical protein [Burkholderia ubonensis]KVP75137.1 hypothetical protein WJ93_06900 [Burkholderia ubonensis]KVP96600.1 hypothetical protein WJ97_12000 [Burkholderia ubonensis]KVP97945.1 hypothetical protein WJ96_05080 [Burkholderia ubonensis]KVZ92642.1 hypothetical protein WL25_16735 [Burkholderia ubonensis]